MGRLTIIVSLAVVLCLVGCSGPSSGPEGAKPEGTVGQGATPSQNPAFKDGFETGDTKQWQGKQQAPTAAPGQAAPLGK